MIEEGAYADILVVDGNPLDDLAAIGADKRWFDAPDRSIDVPSLRIIMKDGKIYKNTLAAGENPVAAVTQPNMDTLLADNTKYPELHFCLHDHDHDSHATHQATTVDLPDLP